MTRLVLLVVPAVLLSGCANHQPTECCSSENPQSLSIELLGFPECPNTPAMRDNLRRALEVVGNGLVFREVDLQALPEADARRSWPAPTVLVNGTDLFGLPPSNGPIGCRAYDDAEGVPGAPAIAERIRALEGNAGGTPVDCAAEGAPSSCRVAACRGLPAAMHHHHGG